jgi:hypothetical protein
MPYSIDYAVGNSQLSGYSYYPAHTNITFADGTPLLSFTYEYIPGDYSYNDKSILTLNHVPYYFDYNGSGTLLPDLIITGENGALNVPEEFYSLLISLYNYQ